MMHFQQNKNIIILFFLLCTLFIIGCDPIELEKQDQIIINGSNDAKYDNSGIIVSASKDERLELSESIPEKHVIQLAGLNESVTIKKTVKRSDVIDFQFNNNIVAKIYVAQVPNYNEVWLSINGEKAKMFKKGDSFEIKKPYIVSITGIQFKEKNDVLESMIEFSFFVEEREKYDEFLIEQDVGLHEYIESFQSRAKTYTAEYSDVAVTVKPIISFPKEYPNKENLFNMYNSLIYRSPNREEVTWLSFLENKPYAITVNKNMEGVIMAYLDKFPSFITTKTYCEKEIILDERESTNVTYKKQDISIEVSSILDTTVETKLKVNDGLTVKRGIQEGYEINDNAYLIVDQIEINYEDKKDRVRLCLV